MPKMSKTEPYPKHSWYIREENAIALPVSSQVNIISS